MASKSENRAGLPMASSSPKSPPFDQALAQLESLLSQLDSGDLSLEASVEKYAEGVELLKLLQASFAVTEERVQNLTDVLRTSLAELEEGSDGEEDGERDN